MPDTKRPLKVFLCHAHADRDAVRILYSRLRREGVDAWLDKEKLLPGQDWEKEIRKAVREADVVVVCLSKQFNQAGFRQKEVRLALDTAMEKPEGDIFIIPARLEDCETLESLRKWHWVDLFEGDGNQSLISALRARAERIGATLRIRRSRKSIASPEENTELPTSRPGADTGLDSSIATETELEKANREAAEKAIRERSTGERPEQKKPKPSRKWNTAIVVALIGCLGTTIAGLLSSPLIERWLEQAPGPTSIATLTITPTSGLPASTEPSILEESTSTLLTELTDDFGTKMVLIPRGEFTMGSNDGDVDEKPVHTVYLDNYYIDKFEVTNALYKMCVDQGKCGRPFSTIDFDNPDYAQHPVVFVNLEPALIYCEWRGARLPTEAEWEKAARGSDERTYPWGEGIDETYANYDGFVAGGKTTPVGQYENGKSFYGVYDMAGNVWEWVADWYDAEYYSVSPSSGPSGPRTGEYGVVRGGAFDGNEELVRTFSRTWFYPDITNSSVGFRCAKDAPP